MIVVDTVIETAEVLSKRLFSQESAKRRFGRVCQISYNSGKSVKQVVRLERGGENTSTCQKQVWKHALWRIQEIYVTEQTLTQNQEKDAKHD